jgi:hypothetical protein
VPVLYSTSSSGPGRLSHDSEAAPPNEKIESIGVQDAVVGGEGGALRQAGGSE